MLFINLYQVELDSAVSDASPHIANIGRMVEVKTSTTIITSIFDIFAMNFT